MSDSKDWKKWHQYYADETSSQSKRLFLVREVIAESLPDNIVSEFHIIDICAGDGRDLLPVLANFTHRDKMTALLVEINEQLANDAASLADGLGLKGVNILNGDASLSTTYQQAVPADLVMLCGVFGNMHPEDIKTIIDTLPQLLKRGGKVIWTIHLRDVSLCESIQQYFSKKDFTLITSVKTEDSSYLVGVHEYIGEGRILVPEKRLFTFVK